MASFYIAQRYLISKKGNSVVTFITWLAGFAMMTAVTSMFVIISVFSGLEELNKDIISNLHSDLTIYSQNGKTLKNIDKITEILKKNKEIKAFSKIIEEKTYISYNNIGEIAYLRGVDTHYTAVNPINKKSVFGEYPSFVYSNEVFIEQGLAIRLGLPVGKNADYAWLYMPKSGEGLIHKQEDIFNKKEIFSTGIFLESEELNNFIIAPIELAQELLNIPKNSAYQVVIKLNNTSQTEEIRRQIYQQIGNKDYLIKTKSEENTAFWKMINTEKLMVYIIFGLVIFITTFNLAGAITILQLDKKQQTKTLISLGVSHRKIRKIYFFTGILIVSFGVGLGLSIGSIICYIQQAIGIFKTGGFPFPVKIVAKNYIIVTLLSFGFGGIISLIFSKINKDM